MGGDGGAAGEAGTGVMKDTAEHSTYWDSQEHGRYGVSREHGRYGGSRGCNRDGRMAEDVHQESFEEIIMEYT